MKSAMHQMIEYLEKDCQQTISNQWKINKAKELLKIEQRQIIRAYDEAYEQESNMPSLSFGAEYYLKSYFNPDMSNLEKSELDKKIINGEYDVNPEFIDLFLPKEDIAKMLVKKVTDLFHNQETKDWENKAIIEILNYI